MEESYLSLLGISWSMSETIMLFVISLTLNRGNQYLFAHISSIKLIAIQCITLLDRRKKNKMEIEKENHCAGDNSI